MNPEADESTPAAVIEVDDKTFETEVLDRSRDVPVVVDFWAEWCGPCRALTPVLEKLALELAGRVVVAKVDVDRCQELAALFQIQSIPAVLGFRDGKAVEEFVGVLPEAEIRAFVERLLPSETDLLVKDARAMRETDPGRAEEILRRALDGDGGCDAARLGLADLLIERGADDEASALLENRLFAGDDEEEAARLRAFLSVRGAAAGLGDEGACRSRLEDEPDNAERLYELGCALAAAARYEDALESLVHAARKDKALGRDKVREAMVNVFHIIGDRSDLANEYRDKLASALY